MNDLSGKQLRMNFSELIMVYDKEVLFPWLFSVSIDGVIKK